MHNFTACLREFRRSLASGPIRVVVAWFEG